LLICTAVKYLQSDLRISNSVNSTPRLYRTKVKVPAADSD